MAENGLGGAFVPSADYTTSGNWTFQGNVTVEGTLTDTGTVLASPTITGTVAGGATYTAPTLTTPALGTPASGVLSSCTAYPLGSLTGAGTGVLTALAIANAASGGYAVNGIAGVANGYKIARSAAPVAVTGTSDITTGLATVLAAFACAESNYDGTAFANCQAVVTGGAGHILLKAWKITAADNGALIAATVAQNISWVAIGT